MEQHQVKVGIAVLVVKDGRVLLGKRKGSHGAGEYALPGGHLEHMESYEGCVRREVLEETGMDIDNIRFLLVANIKEYAPKHYAHIGFVADWKSGEPQLMEPEKCEGWAWYDIESLPQPLFATLPAHIEAYKTGKNFFDA